jgi:hypothetical protein
VVSDQSGRTEAPTSDDSLATALRHLGEFAHAASSKLPLNAEAIQDPIECSNVDAAVGD